MSRIRNVIIGVLLLVGLGYLGLKVYIYHQVKSGLDNAIAAASPFADIRYDGISSSLTGSVTVRNVRVHGFGDDVQVEGVRLGTPNLIYLLGTLSELQRGEPPRFLELQINGLSLALDGPLMNLLQGAMQSKVPQLPASFPCAGQIAFGPAVWRAMGYQRLRNDVFLRVDLDNDAHTIRMQGKWKTADMGDVGFTTELARIDPVFTRDQAAQRALLRSFSFDYTDHSYYKRLVQYCAGRDKAEPSTFISSVVNANATYYMYSWGVVPGIDLRRAYGEFLRNPQSFSVVAHPNTPLELSLLSQYSPDDLVALLDLRAIVNGRGVESSQVSYRPELLGQYAAAPQQPLQWPNAPAQKSQAAKPVPQSSPARSSRPAPQSRPARSTRPAPEAAHQARAQPQAAKPVKPETSSSPTTPQEVAFGYRRVSRELLDRYVGRYVRVYTAEGSAREGVLNAVRDSEVVVEHRMYGGSMAVPVPFGKIERIEVWLPQSS